ncbi:MAG TPA: hypothetical protein VMW76_03155 [Bacteroidales bacterium]|nr:hypothetical protein [Bacteroidales bacterium]
MVVRDSNSWINEPALTDRKDSHVAGEVNPALPTTENQSVRAI